MAESKEKKRIVDDALMWRARLMSGEVTNEQRVAYENWRRSPGVSEIEGELDELMAWTESARETELLRDLNEFADNHTERTVFSPMGARVIPALAASLAIATAAIGLYSSQIFTAQSKFVFETSAGEIQTATLDDGSSIVLNTSTRVSVTYNSRSRSADLQNGEAVFTVRPNPSRPFIVDTPQGRVTVTGTTFGVDVTEGKTTVYVVSGSVDASQQDHTLSLEKGDAATISNADGLLALENYDPELRLAWRSGVLRFRGAPLQLVVADLNEYFDRKIVLSTTELDDLRVTGEFEIDDQASTVHSLALAFGLETSELADRTVLSPRTEP